MNTAEGFNFSTIRYYRIRRFLFFMLKLAPLVVLLSVALFFTVDYLSNLPRERKARSYSYLKRVQYGAALTWDMIYAAFTAPEDRPHDTKLPVVQLFIPGDALERLNSDLPESGKVFQEGLFKLDGKIQEVKVRYRGDSVNHWGFPEKSWRVRFKGDKTYKGIRSINLYLPRTASQIADFMGYWIGEQMQLLTPEAFPIHLRLNGKFSGMRMFLEQVDGNFITRRNLGQGKIYSGDITTSQLYGRTKRKHLFQNAGAWEIAAVGFGDELEAQNRPEMAHLLDILNRAKQDRNLLTTELPKIMDVDAFLKYIALLGIVGSTHVDNSHNQKFYFNTQTGRFIPVVWDTAAYLWGNIRGIDIDSNDLFLQLLTVPEYRERKNRYIWEALHGSLSLEKLQGKISELATLIKNETEANPFKLEAEHRAVQFVSNDHWKKAVKDLLALVKERDTTLKKILSTNAASYNVTQNDNQLILDFLVESHAGFTIREILLEFSDPQSAKSCINPLLLTPSTSTKGITDQNRIKFEANDTLHLTRFFARKGAKKHATGVYQYKIQCENNALTGAVVSVGGENSITKIKHTAKNLTK